MALPSTYTRVEYLESSGTQYIDTGIAPSDYLVSLKIEADMRYTSVPTGSSTQSYLFGTGIYKSTAGNRRNVLVGYRGGTSTTLFSYLNDGQLSNAVAFTGASLDTNRHLFAIDQPNSQYGFDGATQSFGSTDQSTDNLPILIFCARQTGSSGQPVGYYSSARLYSFKIYNNGTLLRDFVPCKDSNDVLGLYDLVNDVFYTNQGTGEFTAGRPYYTIQTGSNVTGSVVTGAGEYLSGTRATVAISPKEGYRFNRWDELGFPIVMNVSKANPYSFIVTKNRHLSAYCTAIPTVAVTIEPSDVGQALGEGAYEAGQIVQLRAVATSPGYEFSHFETSGGEDIYSNPYSFVMGATNVSLTAHFVEKPFLDPIYDRTQGDVDNRTPKGFLNVEDLNRIEFDIYALAQMIGVQVNYQEWTHGMFMTTSGFERILSNIEILRSAVDFTLPVSPNLPINTYQKVNQVEFIIYETYRKLRQNGFTRKYAQQVGNEYELYIGEEMGVI